MSAATSLHAQLKEATGRLHEDLDERFGYLSSDDLDPETYARHLEFVRSVQLPMERRARAVWARARIDERPRGDRRPIPDLWLASDVALEDDLSLLARSGVGERAAVPEAPFPDPLPDEVPGWVYVLEGSRLGGAVVARRIRDARPGLARATRFLSGGSVTGPDDTGPRWKRALRWVESEGARDPAAAVRGAVNAFRIYGRHAEAWAPRPGSRPQERVG